MGKVPSIRDILRCILSIILIFIFDSFALKLICKIGYAKWIFTLIENTKTLFSDAVLSGSLPISQYIKVMGMDIVGLISFLIVVYFVLFTFTNPIVGIIRKAEKTDELGALTKGDGENE